VILGAFGEALTALQANKEFANSIAHPLQVEAFSERQMELSGRRRRDYLPRATSPGEVYIGNKSFLQNQHYLL
jgi:hypothetical protein